LDDPQVEHVRIRDSDGVLVGYAQRDGLYAEVATSDPHVVDRLIDNVVALGGTTIWSHGRRSPVENALRAQGFIPARTLHQMRRPLSDEIVVPPLPAGVVIRPFVPGADEDAFLRVNAAAFADHPEQGDWTRADIEAREAESWFDPAGLLLAERAGNLIGYHFTKRHEDGNGEVYVIGVDPAGQGLGLGKVLLAAGLQYLRERGCPLVLLYVDESNVGARGLYMRVGFVDYDRDIQWNRPLEVGP
jgi:mycothiol synthase